MRNSSQTILIVEDNQDDVFIIKRAFQCAKITNPLHFLGDGQEALDYLVGEGDYGDRDLFPLPFLLFLDLKLPYVHGFEILEWIRVQPALSDMVVVVLTSSVESKDYELAYALGARTYLVKPPTAEMLHDVIDALGSVWLARSAALPVSFPPTSAACLNP